MSIDRLQCLFMGYHNTFHIRQVPRVHSTQIHMLTPAPTFHIRLQLIKLISTNN